MAGYTIDFKGYFQGFSYRMIKFKYFIMVVAALLLEVIAVSVFLLNSENIIELELFNASILFGVTECSASSTGCWNTGASKS